MSDYSISKQNGSWNIQKHGGQRPSATANTKAEAQKLATKFATNSGGGDVFEHSSRKGSVHDKGQIIDRDTHGKPDPRGNG